MRDEMKIKKNHIVLGHVGRFNQQKNHGLLLRIFKAVHDAMPQTVLMLVGDGELREQIEECIHSLGLQDNVILTGIRSDIADLMQAMDVLLFPSIYEGLPVALVEAQASGLPCVISDVITDEVVITDLICKLSLKSPISEWKNAILSRAVQPRRVYTDEIVQSGYDIRSAVHFLEEFYCDIYKA